MELKGKQSKMAGLFIYAAIVQGAVAALITFLGAFGDNSSLLHLYPVSVAHVIAGGQAGNRFIIGYLTYLVVGVVAMAVTSLFYFYIETVQGKVYKGIAKWLAWVHLVLGNIGVAGASILAMMGGYLTGAAMQPVSSGGMGWSSGQVHVNILQYYPTPIAVFLGLGLLGFFLGGIGYLIVMRSK
jgi:hypothetical protein